MSPPAAKTTAPTTLATTDEAATDDAIDGAQLAEAVAGIGTIVPAAPLDVLAPRLRTPLFALFVVLALGAHAAGLGAHVLWQLSEGEDGRNAKATGSHVIEVDIIDGRESDSNGGRLEEAVPGDPAPAAPVAIEQAASAPSIAAEEAPPPPPTPPPDERAPSATPQPAPETTLSTPAPADMVVAAAPPEPPPANELVPSRPEEPQTPPADASAQQTSQTSDPVPRPSDPAPPEHDRAQTSAAEPAVAQPESAPSQASAGGEDGSAQSSRPVDAPAGRAGATPGEIKTYHARLGSRLRAFKPSGFGRKGHVVVAFAVDGDGGLLFAEVKTSSGNTYLESKALAAVRKAAPFPKPPVRMTGKQLQFSVPFTFE